MSLERIRKLMLRYEVPPKYMYKIISDNEYIFSSRPLEVVVCEETIWTGFRLPLHPFIERFLIRYGLVPA